MNSASVPNFLEPPVHSQQPPPVRFAGDGFDFRRPILSTNYAGPSAPSSDVIDLTSDESDTPSSFVSTRRLPPLNVPPRSVAAQQSYQQREGASSSRRNQPGSSHNQNTEDVVDLEEEGQAQTREHTRHGAPREDSDDSDVVFVMEREVTPSNSNRATAGPSRGGGLSRSRNPSRQAPRPQSGFGSLSEIIRDGTLGFFRNNWDTNGLSLLQHVRGFGPYTGQLMFGNRHGGQETDSRREPDFEVMAHRRVRPAAPQIFPPRLDFEAQGFELIAHALDDEPPYPGPATRGRQESPPYKAPSAPPEGFTRQIQEETVVICPNCQQELGRRDYDDLKRQVWVVKACGHVYCGECTKNRFITGKAKNGVVSGSKTPVFKKCVVEDCEKPVQSKTAMLQIYL